MATYHDDFHDLPQWVDPALAIRRERRAGAALSSSGPMLGRPSIAQ
jgi:hypothetical protein